MLRVLQSISRAVCSQKLGVLQILKISNRLIKIILKYTINGRKVQTSTSTSGFIGLSSNAKLFANDTSLFSVVHDINASAIELNSNLKKINDRAFQWKMVFNPDRSKPAQEIIFGRKLKTATHTLFLFNNNIVSQVNSQKHLGVILDVKLTFEEHLKNIFNKTNKTIGVLRNFSDPLPR